MDSKKIIEEPSLRDKIFVFENRQAAGKILAERLKEFENTETIVFAIPSGGVPVAVEISKRLNIELDLIITKKLQIPYNPEAGFGAIDPDGSVILNEKLLTDLKLSDLETKEEIKRALNVLRRRELLFRKGRPYPDIKNKNVIVVDDGIASGYTMLSAVRFLKKRNPEKIVIAVPTGLLKTLIFISNEVDVIYCLNVRTGIPFAVADAYNVWYDLSEKDVLIALKSLW